MEKRKDNLESINKKRSGIEIIACVLGMAEIGRASCRERV